MKLKKNKTKGQTIVEYILIITLVAVASIVILGIFSDRIRTIIAGAASTFGATNAAEEVQENSVEILRNLEAGGLELDGN